MVYRLTKFKTMNQVNVASKQSENGHFVKNAKKVILVDEITETTKIEGAAVLETKNHTTLPMEEKCLITIQQVFNPFSKLYEKVKD